MPLAQEAMRALLKVVSISYVARAAMIMPPWQMPFQLSSVSYHLKGPLPLSIWFLPGPMAKFRRAL